MYKVGMYGGCFDPLHIGHINVIAHSAALCEELHIILSWSAVRDRIDYKLRYRWLLNSCKHLPNVIIHAVEDTQATKSEYNWEQGAEDIKKAVGKPIDAVFCGSDYNGTNRFESLYPNATIRYIPRFLIPTSSTEIFADPIKNWEYIPKVARPYFCKKVLIIGGESTGKSVMCESLATAYNTECVGEWGRYTCERAGGEDFMTKADLYENLIMQRAEIYKAEQTANKVLFVDTDSLTTAFYGGLLGGGEWESVVDLGVDINNTINWDLVIFLEPTVPFVQDGTRNEEIAADRKKFSEQLRAYYDRLHIPYKVVNGENYAVRLTQAKDFINHAFFRG